MEIQTTLLADIIPYARNPRNNAAAVAKVKASLKEFGWKQPIVVGTDGVIIVGHTRYQAALEMGLESAPVLVARDLTPLQAKAYRIADNRTGETAQWNYDLLALEFAELKEFDFDPEMTAFDLEDIDRILGSSAGDEDGGEGGEESGEQDDHYSRKIIAPIYEPKGEKPSPALLYDETKTRALIADIDRANLPDDVADFLRVAAQRHTVFHFRRIADFYAHSDANTQDLMERSALVIIDFDKAIEYGFVAMSERLGKIADMEEQESRDA